MEIEIQDSQLILILEKALSFFNKENPKEVNDVLLEIFDSLLVKIKDDVLRNYYTFIVCLFVLNFERENVPSNCGLEFVKEKLLINSDFYSYHSYDEKIKNLNLEELYCLILNNDLLILNNGLVLI